MAKPKNTPSSQKAHTHYNTVFLNLAVVIFIFTAIIIILLLFMTFTQTPNNPTAEHQLPSLHITLKNVSIEEIDSSSIDNKYPNNTAVFTIGHNTEVFNDIEIKGRGNHTWTLPKRAYQIKLKHKANLFNFGPAKKWVLLADYSDETHLRNSTAFFLQHLLNSENPIDGQHIELYINDTYHGLYYLSEKVEIGKNRINLKDPLGIIAELDNLHNTDETCAYHSKNGNCLTIQDIVNTDNSTIAIESFTDKFNELESAIEAKDYQSIAQIIDIDSFAKYFLLNEFAINPDAYGSSFFLYTDGINDQIHAGSGWDFDAAFGNRHLLLADSNYATLTSPLSAMSIKKYLSNNEPSKTLSSNHFDRLSTVVYDLMDIPEFSTRAQELYQNYLSGKKPIIINHIKTQADIIKQAAIKDRELWNLELDFTEEVDYLIDWIEKRCDYLDQFYNPQPTPHPQSY